MEKYRERLTANAEDFDSIIAGVLKDFDLMRTLLGAARCPQCDGDGACYDNMGEVYQCQWCYETEEILK